jgi:hypothetical protein
MGDSGLLKQLPGFHPRANSGVAANKGQLGDNSRRSPRLASERREETSGDRRRCIRSTTPDTAAGYAGRSRAGEAPDRNPGSGISVPYAERHRAVDGRTGIAAPITPAASAVGIGAICCHLETHVCKQCNYEC